METHSLRLLRATGNPSLRTADEVAAPAGPAWRQHPVADLKDALWAVKEAWELHRDIARASGPQHLTAVPAEELAALNAGYDPLIEARELSVADKRRLQVYLAQRGQVAEAEAAKKQLAGDSASLANGTPGHFERPNRSIDGRSTAVRDCRDSLVARESPPVLAVVEGVQQRPQDIHKGAGNGASVLLYALTYTMMRASALRSRGTPGASPKTFSRRGAQQQARSENDTSLLRRVAQTRPEEAGTGVSPPVARILLPSGLILGQLGAATHPSFPTEVGLPPAVPPAGFACLDGTSFFRIG